MTRVTALQRKQPPGAAFLKALWGPEPRGYVQIWTLDDKTSTYLTDPAAAHNFHEHTDVYTAVGVTARRLGARQRANAGQIAGLAGMWLDLDIEPGKIPTRTNAFTLASAHLQPTIIVDSGHGLQAWYLFGEPWIFASRAEREHAASLARRFVTLHQHTAAQAGWRIDSVGDLARLMRLPGTRNAKDPGQPRPVVWLGLGDEPGHGSIGPRHTRAAIQALLAGVPDEPLAPAHASNQPIDLTGDTTAFAGKLDALLANSLEFAAAWHHEPAHDRRDLTPSAWDLCLCVLAAAAMTDAELVALMHAHRQHYGYDRSKLHRQRYLELTIGKARDRQHRNRLVADIDRDSRRAA